VEKKNDFFKSEWCSFFAKKQLGFRPRPTKHQRPKEHRAYRLLACLADLVIILTNREKYTGGTDFFNLRAEPTILRNGHSSANGGTAFFYPSGAHFHESARILTARTQSRTRHRTTETRGKEPTVEMANIKLLIIHKHSNRFFNLSGAHFSRFPLCATTRHTHERSPTTWSSSTSSRKIRENPKSELMVCSGALQLHYVPQDFEGAFCCATGAARAGFLQVEKMELQRRSVTFLVKYTKIKNIQGLVKFMSETCDVYSHRRALRNRAYETEPQCFCEKVKKSSLI
jgi:hypothetical protein